MGSRSDTLVWAVLALQAGLFYVLVRDRLGILQTVTEIKHKEPPQRSDLDQGDEDALKVDTLRTLAQHPDYEIRNKVCAIVSERTAKGDTKYLILDDVASHDPVLRDQALTGLNYLLDKPYTASYFHDLPTYRSVIRCLENLLSEHTDPDHMFSSSIVPKTRPISERKALRVLAKLVVHDTPLALKADIITRWLAKYPFPFLEGDESKRVDVVMMVTEHAGDWESNLGGEPSGEDPDMGEIVRNLCDCRAGANELEKHGLCIPRRRNERNCGTPTIPTDTWMVGGESTAGFVPSGVRVQDADPIPRRVIPTATVGSTRRHQGESVEERALRRRRREAMVLGDGGRPLGRDNIFQRRPTNGQLEPRDRQRRESDREIEREMALLRDEVDQEDEEMGLDDAAEREWVAQPQRTSSNSAQNGWALRWGGWGW